MEIFTNLPSLISDAVEANQWIGYAAILLAMFLENIIPPIPSEIIMPLGGYYVFAGKLDFFPVVLAGLIGTVLGAYPWYGLGRIANENKLEALLNKYGQWIGISSEELQKSKEWFDKYGKSLVFWGRLIPGIRTLISVPAGVELMPIVPFTIWTTAGSLIWTIFLTTAGIILGESYSRAEEFLLPFSSIVKKLLLILALSFSSWIVIRTLKKRFKNR